MLASQSASALRIWLLYPPQFHCKRNPSLDILGKEGREETGLVILRNLIR